MRTTKRLLVLPVLVLFAVACSRTEFLYARADWLALRWVDDLVDVHAAQKDAWRGHLAQAMEQHRRALLPAVVGFIGDLEDAVAGGLTADALDCWLDAADTLYHLHARWAAAPAAQILADLVPDQVAHLAGELELRNAEYVDDFLDPDPRRREAERVERYVERVEYWTGELSTVQLRAVRELAAGLPDPAGAWLDYRRERQHRLLELLRADADAATLEPFLDAWWARLAGRSPELVAQTARLREGVAALILRLQALLDESQRAHVRERLAELREGLAPAVDAVADARRVGTPSPAERCTLPVGAG